MSFGGFWHQGLARAWYGIFGVGFDGDLALASRRSTRLFWSAARGDPRYAVLGYSQLQLSIECALYMTLCKDTVE